MFDDLKTQFNQQISEIRHQSSYLSDKLTAISKTSYDAKEAKCLVKFCLNKFWLIIHILLRDMRNLKGQREGQQQQN